MTYNEPFGFFVISTIGFLPAGLMPITRIIRNNRKQYFKALPLPTPPSSANTSKEALCYKNK